MRTAVPLLIVLLCPPSARAQDWRTPIALDIPARFEINLRGIPSRCYQVVRPPDGRLTAEVLGPGRWNVCIGDSRCPTDCLSGESRKASTEPLTNGSHYFVMVERVGSDAMATLAVYPTAANPARPALPTAWTAVVPAKNFRRGGYKILDNGGQLTLVSWDGKTNRAQYRSDGSILGADNVTGAVTNGGRRIDWSNGTYWLADGPAPSTGRAISGSWTAVVPAKNFRRGGYRITENAGTLTFISWDGVTFTGRYLDESTVSADQGKVTGKISPDGKRIDWSNATYWER